MVQLSYLSVSDRKNQLTYCSSYIQMQFKESNHVLGLLFYTFYPVKLLELRQGHCCRQDALRIRNVSQPSAAWFPATTTNSAHFNMSNVHLLTTATWHR